MIGIFRKDVYMLLSAYKKNLLLVFAFYAAIALGTKSTLLPTMMIWLMGFYALSALTMDASSGWDRYARTLPVTPGRIVAARFLVTLGMIAAGALYSVLLDAALCLLYGLPAGRMLAMAAGGVAGALLSAGLLLPAAYKWGAEKARSAMLALIFAGSLCIWVLGKKNALRSFFDWLENRSPVWMLALLLLLCAAVFVLGGVISCHVYRNKEF